MAKKEIEMENVTSQEQLSEENKMKFAKSRGKIGGEEAGSRKKLQINRGIVMTFDMKIPNLFIYSYVT